MPFIALPYGFRVSMEYQLHGQVVVNVYHVITGADPIVMANLTLCAQLFRAWWANNFAGNFPDDIALHRITVKSLSVPNHLEWVEEVSPPVTGQQVTTSAPNNVALAVAGKTGFSGRWARGRNYLAGLNISEVVDNYIGTALAAAILADMVTLKESLTAENFTLGVASFFYNGAPRTFGVLTPYTMFTVDLRVDTQRKRLPGEGV